MKFQLINIAHKIISLFLSEKIDYKGMIIPAKYLRLCGKRYWDDEYFLSTGISEVDRIIESFGLTAKSRILDVGCGVGRLPIGILARIGEIQHYRGIDVSKSSIQWCRRHITPLHTGFQFVHIDFKNARYNPKGKAINIDFRLPFDDEEFDIIYLYSVFSHMTTEDIRLYLKEFQRLLVPSGKVFLTAFLENEVPDMTVNPRNYRMCTTKEPLLRVLYNKDFFYSLLTDNNFDVDRFDYEKEPDGQCALYLNKK